MSNQLPAEKLLEIKVQAALMIERTQGVSYRSFSLQPEMVVALVECAEALRAYRNKSEWHDMKKAALTKLEAL